MSAFVTERILRFADCDPAGIAYFPRCYDMMNGVVEDWWAAMGFPWRVSMMDLRIGLPTVAMNARFAAPSLMGDNLTCSLSVARLGRASLELRHAVHCGEEFRFGADQTVVCTSLDTHKSQPWPEPLRAAFAPYLESPDAQYPAA